MGVPTQGKDMTDLNPERFTLRQAAQARDDFAQITDELDLGEVVRRSQPEPTPLAKGGPNRKPKQKSKRRAPSQ